MSVWSRALDESRRQAYFVIVMISEIESNGYQKLRRSILALAFVVSTADGNPSAPPSFGVNGVCGGWMSSEKMAVSRSMAYYPPETSRLSSKLRTSSFRTQTAAALCQPYSTLSRRTPSPASSSTIFNSYTPLSLLLAPPLHVLCPIHQPRKRPYTRLQRSSASQHLPTFFGICLAHQRLPCHGNDAEH